MSVTYDAGALIAAERNDRTMWALHAGFLAEDAVPVVPAAVLAQVWRGGARQAAVARLLAACSVDDLTEPRSKAVGRLVGAARHPDIVDASVVETAVRHGGAIVTSDPADLSRIAQAANAKVEIHAL